MWQAIRMGLVWGLELKEIIIQFICVIPGVVSLLFSQQVLVKGKVLSIDTLHQFLYIMFTSCFSDPRGCLWGEKSTPH